MSQDPKAALEAADALISRLQETMADHLALGERLDEAAAFYELVEILEIAPEIATVRMALGREPTRFGEDSPVAHGGHTG
jgi:hypothetical protein